MTEAAIKIEQENHPSLFYEVGDIVVSAPLSPTKVQPFRVHKAFLSVHSSIFRATLSLPSLPNTNDTVEGVPIIKLHDNAMDMAGFLSALYNPACASNHFSGLIY